MKRNFKMAFTRFKAAFHHLAAESIVYQEACR